MVVVDDDRPCFSGQFDDLSAHGPIGLDDPAGVVTAVDVGARIGRVGQDAEHPGVDEASPAQLTGPHSAVGAQGNRRPSNAATT
jgi:hypothetical protein